MNCQIQLSFTLVRLSLFLFRQSSLNGDIFQKLFLSPTLPRWASTTSGTPDPESTDRDPADGKTTRLSNLVKGRVCYCFLLNILFAYILMRIFSNYYIFKIFLPSVDGKSPLYSGKGLGLLFFLFI